MECSLNILSAVVLATTIVTAPATQAAETPEFRIVVNPASFTCRNCQWRRQARRKTRRCPRTSNKQTRFVPVARPRDDRLARHDDRFASRWYRARSATTPYVTEALAQAAGAKKTYDNHQEHRASGRNDNSICERTAEV